MSKITRRRFVATAAGTLAALAASGAAPPGATAGPADMRLRATTRTLDVDGRAATVNGLLPDRGGPGLVLDPGQRLRGTVVNELSEETLIHWHGQIPPNAQDGARNTNPMLAPGASRSYDFATRPGTYWMHAHVPPQEIDLLAAPLIVHSEADLRADRQEVIVMLHDFSFTPGKEILAELAKGMAHHGMGHGGHAGHGMDHAGHDHGAMDHAGHGPPRHGSRGDGTTLGMGPRRHEPRRHGSCGDGAMAGWTTPAW